ncbi:MAG: hypothetical protein H6696_19475 [Deferribacteres bacterium]|nr:hypothetical protein [Deferribacteres bacterium]
MKLKKIILLCLIPLLLSGCLITSFYPLYTKDTLVLDDRILGKWEEFNRRNKEKDDEKETIIWEISFPEKIVVFKYLDDEEIKNEFTYHIVAYDKNAPQYKASFYLHLVKLENEMYADFYPLEDIEWDYQNELMAMHLVPAHTFSHIELDEKRLYFHWMHVEFLRDLIKQNQIRIRHENNERNIMLTAGSEDLQKFLIKYGKNKEAYEHGVEMEFVRAE